METTKTPVKPYPAELRERAVRMVREHASEHEAHHSLLLARASAGLKGRRLLYFMLTFLAIPDHSEGVRRPGSEKCADYMVDGKAVNELASKQKTTGLAALLQDMRNDAVSNYAAVWDDAIVGEGTRPIPGPVRIARGHEAPVLALRADPVDPPPARSNTVVFGLRLP